MRTNDAGLNLIKSFEGCSLRAYKLAGESYYTIGYGHSFDNSISACTCWSQKEADEHLINDLQVYERYVTEDALSKFGNMNENQFSALVSYCYNRGRGGLRQLVNASTSLEQMADNIVIYWGSATLYKNGLVRRREAEKALFNTPIKVIHTKSVEELVPGTVIKITSYYKTRRNTRNPVIKKRTARILKIYPNDVNPYQLGSRLTGKKFGYCNYGDIQYIKK